MINLALSFHRRARVWLQELPPLDYDVVDTLEAVQDAKTSTLGEHKVAGVDLLIPLGGHYRTGTLGASFTPTPTSDLTIQISVSDTDTEKIDWLLGSRLDDIRAGLPRPYAVFVLREAADLGYLLGAGTLQIHCAAHGKVGSSPHLFQQLTRIIINLLSQDAGSLSEEELANLIVSCLNLG